MALYIDGSTDVSKLDDYEEGTFTPTMRSHSNINSTSGFDTTIGMMALAVAGVLVFNVISGNCYIYRVLGINTCPGDLKSE